MIIWLSGPTGAGKSTLAEFLVPCGYGVVREEIPAERFAAFASDPYAHCASLQEQIMRSRLARWRDLSERSNIVFDRSVSEDINVFCRMHHEAGYLKERDIAKLRSLACQLESTLPQPDLIIHMCPDHAVLTQRIAQGTHPLYIVQHLARQIDLYTDWINARSESILRIDNSLCRPDTLKWLFKGR